jgi:hypothetical protein
MREPFWFSFFIAEKLVKGKKPMTWGQFGDTFEKR